MPTVRRRASHYPPAKRRPYDDHPDHPPHSWHRPRGSLQNIRAAQTDLLDALPGVHLPDLGELRARQVLGTHPTELPSPRRSLGAGHTNDAVPDPSDPRPTDGMR
uniref:hypothetical protein n=1 Tax=Streptomyces sp. NBC_01562 TaxID=2975879 RepID=UPI002F906920